MVKTVFNFSNKESAAVLVTYLLNPRIFTYCSGAKFIQFLKFVTVGLF